MPWCKFGVLEIWWQFLKLSILRSVSRPKVLNQNSMEFNRRNFIRTTGLMALAGVAGVETLFASAEKKSAHKLSKGLSLRFLPYDLQLRHTFTLSNSSRKNTPDMLTRIEWEGVVGYGEASMPPYLDESVETASRFLSSLDLSQFNDPFQMDDILQYVDSVMPGNTAAKAAVDIALHDLVGKTDEAALV